MCSKLFQTACYMPRTASRVFRLARSASGPALQVSQLDRRRSFDALFSLGWALRRLQRLALLTGAAQSVLLSDRPGAAASSQRAQDLWRLARAKSLQLLPIR